MLGRKKVAKKIFWALAIIIVPSFVFWGVGDGIRGARRNIAARVNRENITRQEFNSHLQNLLDRQRRYQDREIAHDSPEMKELRRQALEDLIEQRLLFQQARKMGIRVSDAAIMEEIRRDAAFRDEEGEFDQERFDQLVRFVPEEQWLQYEEEIRRSLTLRKLHEAVTAAVAGEVTDEDIAAAREEFGFSPDLDDDIVKQFASYHKKQRAYEQWLEKVRAEAGVRIFDLDQRP